MSDARPFKGMRPRKDLVEKVASPPYDVMNEAEARAMADGNPYSFLHVVRAEIDFPVGVDSHDDAVYLKGAANLKELEAEGVLVRDQEPAYYVYELTMAGHVQTGIIFGASAQEYEDGLIKKHEFTRRVKEDDRAHHVDILNANTGPVMLTYRAQAGIDRLVEQVQQGAADTDYVADDGVRHRLWVLSDSSLVGQLRTEFSAVEALYVADGHHRSAAGYRVRNLRRDRNPGHTGNEAYNHYLAVAFPDNQLQILGYYRAVETLAGLTQEEFLARVRESFEVTVTSNPEPTGLHHFTMFLDGQWYSLTALPGTFPEEDPVGSLDCSILQENVLRPLLGIADPRTSEGIDFIGGIRGTRELERRCRLDMAVAFALYPVTVAQLIAIADAGEVMPPKSTWFEPKLRSGMVTRSLDDSK
jgi:uncharacterized protein (DUF1015 family)